MTLEKLTELRRLAEATKEMPGLPEAGIALNAKILDLLDTLDKATDVLETISREYECDRECLCCLNNEHLFKEANEVLSTMEFNKCEK